MYKIAGSHSFFPLALHFQELQRGILAADDKKPLILNEYATHR